MIFESMQKSYERKILGEDFPTSREDGKMSMQRGQNIRN